MPATLPTVRWVRQALRYNAYHAFRGKVLEAYMTATDDHGHIVIAVVIPERARQHSTQVSEYFHASFTSESQWKQYDGKPVDFQFFYPGEDVGATCKNLPNPVKLDEK